ncbi:hypothetical protein KOW79_020954 [Hemibagrus wyckioides]|uniref:Uncharacterized protein n=1 Tax=Hemibagrus wyckioides TaxID=337641 RepID=A0A9D3N486_9TELE|nr:hypothetical protein KOW79_020954 [Hemibagrus wyckioides]
MVFSLLRYILTTHGSMESEEQRHFQPWRDYMGLAETVRAMRSSRLSESPGPEAQQELGFISHRRGHDGALRIFPEPEMSELGDKPKTQKGRPKCVGTGTVGSQPSATAGCGATGGRAHTKRFCPLVDSTYSSVYTRAPR